jgi:hypothetical protein
MDVAAALRDRDGDGRTVHIVHTTCTALDKRRGEL